MQSTNMQIIYQLLIFVMLIGLSVSRPNGSQESDNQAVTTDNEKIVPYYRALQYFNYEDPNAVDRIQLPYSSFIPSSYRGGGNSANLLTLWDPLRQIVAKRQNRYRQCYFNPISCFRK